jgi:hypothetical protein
VIFDQVLQYVVYSASNSRGGGCWNCEPISFDI